MGDIKKINDSEIKRLKKMIEIEKKKENPDLVKIKEYKNDIQMFENLTKNEERK